MRLEFIVQQLINLTIFSPLLYVTSKCAHLPSEELTSGLSFLSLILVYGTVVVASSSEFIQGGTSMVMVKVCVGRVLNSLTSSRPLTHKRCTCWPHLYLSGYQQKEMFMTLNELKCFHSSTYENTQTVVFVPPCP